MIHKPAWFRDGEVFFSYAPTVGINKDGEELFVVDAASGNRTTEIDDQIAQDVSTLVQRNATTTTSRWVEAKSLTDRLIAVPAYFDERPVEEFNKLMQQDDMSIFGRATIGELVSQGSLIAMNGHGSPSADLRTGLVPYIKVSDIRAGQVNINPTNRVTQAVATKYWRGEESGLRAYDLITPIRTSKNIGEFAVLMPGQENVVLTKEVLVLRASEKAIFDNFYLLWAMTLRAVRRQWDRIVFMQTNREDVGRRYNEIEVPIPPNNTVAHRVSDAFREYYMGTHLLRENFLNYLDKDDRHHIFISTSTTAQDLDEYDDPAE